MVQQINLLTPILLQPKRYFSALAMAQALGLLLLAGGAFVVWLNLQARESRLEFIAAKTRAAAEQQRLVQALASLPAAVNAAQFKDRLSQLDQERVQQLQTLAALNQGLAVAGERHSDVLRLLAQSVPPSIWLSEMRWQAGRLALSGSTLEPADLQAWLQRLAQHRVLAGLQLGAVTVEQWSVGGPNASASMDAPPAALRSAALPNLRPGVPVWSFRAVSERPVRTPTPGAAP